MKGNYTVNCQSSIKILGSKTLYFDPYCLSNETGDADIIFITHDHYDHFDISSINKIKNESTIIVVPKTLKKEVLKIFKEENIFVVSPYMTYMIDDIKFKTILAYNINKNFHPKENDWVGYLVTMDDTSYYIMGDTDLTYEAKTVKADVLFIPIGGTYTMDRKEAVELTNIIEPKVAIPIHYGKVVGSKDDAYYFVKNISPNINGLILIP